MRLKSKQLVIIISLSVVLALTLASLVISLVLYKGAKDGIKVVFDKSSEYVFISSSSDNKHQMYYDICVYAKDAINNKYGATISIKSESYKEGDREIVVGPTKRGTALTEEQKEQLGETGYLIEAVGKKIYIHTYSEAAGKAAVDKLLELFGNDENKTLTVPLNTKLSSHITEDELIESSDVQSEFTLGPVVYAVEDDYQIIFHTNKYGIAWVEIDGQRYYDDYNGVVKSESRYHRVNVPAEKLDETGEYKIAFAPVSQRPPYSPGFGKIISQKYNFRPVDLSDGLQIYVLADVHNQEQKALEVADYYGDKLDLLVLCGDINGDSIGVDKLELIMNIAHKASFEGSIPVVSARGNHECRGEAAEKIADYMGTDNGKTYFTFRIGKIWGLVLDWGEDKEDSHKEYGGMADYTDFRKQQLEFLEEVVRNKDSEYAAEGIEYRIAVCHVPFAVTSKDLDRDILDQWIDLCYEMDLDILLSGHIHKIKYYKKGAGSDKQNYPVITCSKGPVEDFTGAAVNITEDKIKVDFTNGKKESIEEHIIER